MPTPRTSLLGALALAGALLSGLAGCSSDDDGPADDPTPAPSASPDTEDPPSETASATPSETPSQAPVPPGTPACADVWTDGATLARVYTGCADGDTYVEADRLGCSSGQRIVTYADRFFAVAGSTVTETAGPLRADDDYNDAVARCRG